MTKLIEQFVRLAQKYIPAGHSDESLYAHFEYELEHDEILWMGRGKQVLAFCDWSWISRVEEVEAAHNGEKTSGPVLCVLNLVLVEPGLIFPGQRLLPKYRWIAWRDYRTKEVHAPKGWPTNVELTV